jgi:hypothetical protein
MNHYYEPPEPSPLLSAARDLVYADETQGVDSDDYREAEAALRAEVGTKHGERLVGRIDDFLVGYKHGEADATKQEETSFFERVAFQQGARREMLEFAIALADDRLNKRGDPIACHIYLIEALRGVRLSDELQDEARSLLEAMDDQLCDYPTLDGPCGRRPGHEGGHMGRGAA